MEPIYRHIPKELAEMVAAGGVKAYLVGGSVRDLLLGRAPPDWDIAVSGDPHGLAQALARKFGARAMTVEQGGRVVSRILSGIHRWDIGPLDRDGIQFDLARRDFTINAMAYDLRRNRLVDPWAGLRDLEAGLLRSVSAEAIQKDPVRILRAYRIAAQLDFRIEGETATDMAKKAGLLRHAPCERIHAEMMALMKTSRAASRIRQMGDSGAIFAVIPELEAIQRCPAGGAHDRDGWHHTLDVVDGVERKLNNPQRMVPIAAAEAVRHFDKLRGARIKTAALLHDIGKPSTRTLDAEGVVHHYGHERIGAALAASVCRRLRFSRREIEHIALIVRHHLRPLLLFLNGHKRPQGDRAVARLMRQLGGRLPDLVLHSLADTEAKKPWRFKAEQRRFEKFLEGLLDRHFRFGAIPEKEPSLLSGNDLIDHFDLKPSPLFRELLNGAIEGQIAGDLRTKDQALAWVARELQRRSEKKKSVSRSQKAESSEE